MQKEQCDRDYENHNLEMTEEKCEKCEIRYECKYYLMDLADIVDGN